MTVIGQAALLVALLASLWSVLAAILAVSTRREAFLASAGRGIGAAFLLLLLACLGLVRAFLADDFSLEYVADYSCRSQATIYKLTALWGGQSGSLLFWATLLGLFATLTVLTTRRLPRRLVAWTFLVEALVLLFFVLVVALVDNPFRRLPAALVPADGVGLNPLLRNPWMVAHPPALYLGYVGITVPFAFAIAALATRRVDGPWLGAIRRWSMFTFTFLSLGIFLGAYWAYLELGWGGFWGWDPVENASFMPWLTLTAFLHSVLAHERRGVLKGWAFFLVIVSFLLAVFGTFLTRSGIISSVHAFARTSIGWWFGAFLLLAGCLSFGLLLARYRDLRPDNRLDTLLSREGFFLLGNVLLLGITLVVFWLTTRPAIDELRTGVQSAVEPVVFTRATRPWFIFLLFLMGMGPVTGWRRVSPGALARRALVPAVGAVGGGAALFALGAREPWSLAVFAAALFTVLGVLQAVLADWRARRVQVGEGPVVALARVARSNRRRWGAWVSHVAIVVMAVGIAASTAYERKKVFESIPPGTTVELDGYRLRYVQLDARNTPEYDGLAARIEVTRPGAPGPDLVWPELRVYRGRERQQTTEVAILSTFLPRAPREIRRAGEDLYVIPAGMDPGTGRVSLEVIVHPGINWLWIGGILLLLGTHLAAFPAPEEVADVLAEGVAARPLPAR